MATAQLVQEAVPMATATYAHGGLAAAQVVHEARHNIMPAVATTMPVQTMSTSYASAGQTVLPATTATRYAAPTSTVQVSGVDMNRDGIPDVLQQAGAPMAYAPAAMATHNVQPSTMTHNIAPRM